MLEELLSAPVRNVMDFTKQYLCKHMTDMESFCIVQHHFAVIYLDLKLLTNHLCNVHTCFFGFFFVYINLCGHRLASGISLMIFHLLLCCFCQTDLENFKTQRRNPVRVREGQGVVLLCGPPPHSGGKILWCFSHVTANL